MERTDNDRESCSLRIGTGFVEIVMGIVNLVGAWRFWATALRYKLVCGRAIIEQMTGLQK